MLQCQAYLDTQVMFVLDKKYTGALGTRIESAEALQDILRFDDRTRMKLACDLFGDYLEHDMVMGFHILQSVVFNAVRTHKRVCANHCVVCLDAKADVLMNCGHECVCSECCDEWINIEQTCPVCKQLVTDVYKK